MERFCSIHNAELIIFNTFSFCPQCDKDNDEKELCDADAPIKYGWTLRAKNSMCSISKERKVALLKGKHVSNTPTFITTTPGYASFAINMEHVPHTKKPHSYRIEKNTIVTGLLTLYINKQYVVGGKIWVVS